MIWANIDRQEIPGIGNIGVLNRSCTVDLWRDSFVVTGNLYKAIRLFRNIDPLNIYIFFLGINFGF